MKLARYTILLLFYVLPQQTEAKRGRLRSKDLQEIIIYAKHNFKDIIGKPEPVGGSCFYDSKVSYGIKHSTSISDCDKDGIFDIQFDLYYSLTDNNASKQLSKYENLIMRWLPNFKKTSDNKFQVPSGNIVTIWSDGEVEICLILTKGNSEKPRKEISIIVEPLKGT